MITPEENNLLTQTGRGTPCGELMRRYWQPAALSEELSADKPLAVQLFGEELILFRDGGGKPALIGRYCAHQGVDMIYGRVEEDGLRCLYHGWLFDTCGKVVLRGDWLPEKERRWDVGQAAYRCGESGGVIYTYMAPGDPSPLPTQEIFAKPPEHSTLTKELRGENYLQGIVDANESPLSDDTFMLPNLVVSLAAPSGAASWVRWHVPVDDNSHVAFTLRYSGESRFTGEPRASLHELLLKAIETIRAEPQAPAVSAEKE
jgi:nitrite reductase/ring-hydroxylating ferredoxin subunit